MAARIGPSAGHGGEAVQGEGLEPVAEGVDGVVVDLDHHPVEAGRGGRKTQRHDEFWPSSRMRRVREDGEGRVLPGPHGAGEVEGVPCLGFERPDATLTQHDGFVPAGDDVVGGEEPLLELGSQPALEQHRRANSTQFGQQRRVVHVPGSDLEHVHAARQQFHLRRVRDLGDEGEAALGANLVDEGRGLQPRAPGSCAGQSAS